MFNHHISDRWKLNKSEALGYICLQAMRCAVLQLTDRGIRACKATSTDIGVGRGTRLPCALADVYSDQMENQKVSSPRPSRSPECESAYGVKVAHSCGYR